MNTYTYGKIILNGEHAVVYGYGAIAIPFNQVKVTCQIENHIGSIKVQSDHFNGEIDNFSTHSFYIAIKQSLDFLNAPFKNLLVRIDSSIPFASGFGSSAAVSVAIIKEIFRFFNTELSFDILYDIALQAEKIAHTNPSGIDCLICASNSAYYFDKTTRYPLHLDTKGYLVVIDTHEKGITKEAVDLVKKNYNKEKMEQLHSNTKEMILAIEKKDLKKIGNIMNDSHKILKSFQLTTPLIDNIISLCNQHALGSKISGAGLGGCIIALFSTKIQAQKFCDHLCNMEVTTWIQKI